MLTSGVEIQGRIVSLDVIRGVAVLGIAAMHVTAFAMPQAAYFNPAAFGTRGPADLVAWALSFILIDGKMRGLFTMLFGAGILLVAERADARGDDAGSVHARRMGWLLVFGLLHYFLIWWGDILTLYAAVGMVAFLLRDLDVRALLRWSAGLYLLHLAIVMLLAASYFDARADALAPGASAFDVRAWTAMAGAFSPPADALAADVVLYQSDYWTIVASRLADWSLPLVSLFMFSFETLAYFLLGMAAYRGGFLTAAWNPVAYRRIATLGLVIGLPASAALAWMIWRSGFDVPTLYLGAVALPAVFRPLLVVTYAALIILAARRGGWLAARFAAAGRMAFSNYLGVSIVMTTIFYGYGFGLFGTVSRIQLWLPLILLWIAMLAWSKPWLDRFAYGPFEWAWRSLAQGRTQPMRRQIRPND